REEIASRFTRGSVSVGLNVQRAGALSEVRLNEAALAQVTLAAQRVSELTGAAPARIDGLLSIRGVLEIVDVIESEAETAARHAGMLTTLRTALDGLAGARAAEGQRLHQVVRAQVDEIARLTSLVDTSPARTIDAIKSRIGSLVAKLVDTGAGLDPARLHQEAVMIATRADVEEELKRLKSHVEAARDLLARPHAAGRKLDFLAQEFNREANTLTSKASDNEIASHGLALKLVVDQMREQVQNIE
ncbi:MAG: YicC/YloC family endoribonuclease, partial [Hyphomicrobium sp.]